MKQIKISDLKLLEILNRVPFFKMFTVSERKAFFASSLTFLQCVATENLIEEGDKETDFYIILSGTAKVLVNQGRDEVATLSAGYFVGESAFIMNQPHSATVQIATESLVIRLDQLALRRFPSSVREKIKDSIINGMALRLADMNSQYLLYLMAPAKVGS